MEGIVAAKAAACIGAAITMGLGAIGPASAQGLVGMRACENIGKYPESAGQIRTTMMIAMGLIETSAVFALIIAAALVAVGYYLN